MTRSTSSPGFTTWSTSPPQSGSTSGGASSGPTKSPTWTTAINSCTTSTRSPYLEGIRDWVKNGPQSPFALSEVELRKRLTPRSADQARAAAEFGLAEYLYRTNRAADAVAHYKEAQRLHPASWNYKRQAWGLGNAERDYGTNFLKEVQKLGGKPYYEPRQLPELKKVKD